MWCAMEKTDPRPGRGAAEGEGGQIRDQENELKRRSGRRLDLRAQLHSNCNNQYAPPSWRLDVEPEEESWDMSEW